MLGKLCAAELRALWRRALVLLAVMVVAGLGGMMAATAANIATAGSDPFGVVSMTVSSLVMLTLFLSFIVWASLVAMFVLLVVRFYRTLFTDQGYLTLTLPVRSSQLILAKFLVAYGIMLVFVFVALGLGWGVVSSGISGSGPSFAELLSLCSGLYGFVHEWNAVSAVVGALTLIVGAAYQLALAFVSFSLAAWWARRHKVAAAVGLFIGIGWAVSLVFSIGGFAYAFTGVVGTAIASTISLLQLATNACLTVAFLVLAAYLVNKKIDLS